jgi:hypothetical protein
LIAKRLRFMGEEIVEISEEWQPIEMDLELNSNKKTSRFNQVKLGWWCVCVSKVARP